MLGEKLRNLRKTNNLSQEKLAEMVGVSRQAISKWEGNLANPDTKNLICLAKIFKISINELTDTVNSNEKALEKKRKHHVKFKIFQPIVTYTAFMILFGIKTNDKGFYLFMSVLILIPGIFMAWNILSDKDIKQRRINIRIELLYCLLIYFIMNFVAMAIGNIFSGIISIVCCVIYLMIINPRFMNRKIFNYEI